jgi:hypothetical protein
MPRRSDKAREPEDIRQTALRMRESDHQWLSVEAKKHRQTLNSEIMWRLGVSRIQSLGVDLQVIIEAVIPRLEPYLAAANERDAYTEGMLAAREMADVLAPLLAAGMIKGEAAKRAAGAINRLNLARFSLECALGENKVLVPGHASWQAAAEARLRDPAGKGLNAKELEVRALIAKELEAKGPEARALIAKELEAKELAGKALSATELLTKALLALEARGLEAKEPEAKEPSDKESVR